MNNVGFSCHTLSVDFVLFITIICTSSISSKAATWTPERIIFEAAAAASLIVEKVTTPTLVSAGMTASFSVTSVTKPSVPSEPMNRLLRLYPADVFLYYLIKLTFKLQLKADYVLCNLFVIEVESFLKEGC